VDVKSGRQVERLDERGYASLAALLACVIDRASFPSELRAASESDHYYPATLHLLALAAVNLRYQSCVKG
jgi:endoglucanase